MFSNNISNDDVKEILERYRKLQSYTGVFSEEYLDERRRCLSRLISFSQKMDPIWFENNRPKLTEEWEKILVLKPDPLKPTRTLTSLFTQFFGQYLAHYNSAINNQTFNFHVEANFYHKPPEWQKKQWGYFSVIKTENPASTVVQSNTEIPPRRKSTIDSDVSNSELYRNLKQSLNIIKV